jgi:hypothetical protein
MEQEVIAMFRKFNTGPGEVLMMSSVLKTARSFDRARNAIFDAVLDDWASKGYIEVEAKGPWIKLTQAGYERVQAGGAPGAPASGEGR